MRGVIRQIFSDHWDYFVESTGKNKIRPSIIVEVERMLGCDDFTEIMAVFISKRITEIPIQKAD